MPAPDADVASLVIAVDGPSGSGKSTLARGVARALGLRYLDTGAMYRALTWWVLHQGVAPTDEPAVLASLEDFHLDLSTDPLDRTVRVAENDVTAAIRSAGVTFAVSAVSAIPEVRRRLVAMQREIIGSGAIAVEGRDIGTVVCPDAAVKIFLTAAVDARATRRSLETRQAGVANAEVAQVRVDLDRRDRLDSGRVASPLTQAPDALAIDSTALDAEQVRAAVLAIVRERTGIAPATEVRLATETGSGAGIDAAAEPTGRRP